MPLFTSWFFFLTAWSQQTENSEKIIANAHMPAIAKDKEENIHIVFMEMGRASCTFFQKTESLIQHPH